MQFGDAAAIIEMAHALAAAVGDPAPRLTKDDLIRDGFGSGRWFDCFVAEADGTLTGYTLACKAYEAHTAHRRLWLGDLAELSWPLSLDMPSNSAVTPFIGSFGD